MNLGGYTESTASPIKTMANKYVPNTDKDPTQEPPLKQMLNT